MTIGDILNPDGEERTENDEIHDRASNSDSYSEDQNDEEARPGSSGIAIQTPEYQSDSEYQIDEKYQRPKRPARPKYSEAQKRDILKWKDEYNLSWRETHKRFMAKYPEPARTEAGLQSEYYRLKREPSTEEMSQANERFEHRGSNVVDRDRAWHYHWSS